MSAGTSVAATAADAGAELRTELLGKPFYYPARSLIGSLVRAGIGWDDVLRTIVDALVPGPAPVIVDVGANVGASLRQMLDARPRARVIAFEPSRKFLPYLRKNVAALDGAEVRIVSKVLGPASGTSWLYTGDTTGGVVWAGPDHTGAFGRELAEVTTLDEAIPPTVRVDFLKIDVDGWDFEVLRGGRRVLGRDRPLLFVEFSDLHLARPIEELEDLARAGYDTWAVLAPSPQGRLVGVTRDPHEVVGWSRRHGYVDLLCAASGTTAAERLRRLLVASFGSASSSDAERAPLAHSKICEVEDFAHPELATTIREVFAHETLRSGPAFPIGVEYRKHWEIGMAVRALRAGGVLDRGARLLGVGAGIELTTFHLANHVRQVVATDLYGAGGIWNREAPLRVLRRPQEFAPFRFDPERVRFLEMDGRRLEFADETFDGVYSSSSIEHFGTLEDVSTAIREIGRVLRPGGTAALATELRIDGGRGALELPSFLVFDEETLRRAVLEASDELELVGTLDTRVSARTRESVSALRDHVEHRGRWRARNPTAPPWQEPQWERYPHVALAIEGCLFGSVHLTFRKRAGRARPRRVAPRLALSPRPPHARAIGIYELAGGLTEAQDRLLGAIESAGATLDRVDLFRTLRAGAAEAPAPPAVNLVTSALHAVAGAGALPFATITGGAPAIASCFWEASVLTDAVARAVPRVDEIWVASEFNRAVFSRYTTAPIRVLPPPLAGLTLAPDRRRFGLPLDRRIFLSAFAVRSFLPRKNPFGAIRAFARAFGRSRAGGPLLVIKLQHAADDPAAVAEIARELEAVGGRLIVEDLDREAMDRLLASADVHVSLHRAEGFGLAVAESMALGVPAIATAYSGTADFVSEENGYPVRCAIRPVLSEDVASAPAWTLVFPVGSEWAEPDLDDAARRMTEAYERPEEARRKGARARIDVLAHCDPRRIGREAVAALAARAGTA